MGTGIGRILTRKSECADAITTALSSTILRGSLSRVTREPWAKPNPDQASTQHVTDSEMGEQEKTKATIANNYYGAF